MISSTLFPHNSTSQLSTPSRITLLAASTAIIATAGLHLIPRLFGTNVTTRKKPTRVVRFIDEKGITRYGDYCDATSAYQIKGDVYDSSSYVTSTRHTITSYLPPIPPTSILCIGLNYKTHVEETDMKLPKIPTLFMKNIASATGHESNIVTPAVCEYQPQIDFEGELCVVIGRDAYNVSEEDALDYVLGYTVGNDVSARDWQLNEDKSGTQWIRGKSFDTFAPLGPYLLLASSFPSPQAHASFLSSLHITTTLNDTIMQDGYTQNMLFDVQKLIAFATQGTTLVKGTVIMTGTPSGVGFARRPPVWMAPGDEISVEITGLGKLTNYVVASCCAGKKR